MVLNVYSGIAITHLPPTPPEPLWSIPLQGLSFSIPKPVVGQKDGHDLDPAQNLFPMVKSVSSNVFDRFNEVWPYKKLSLG